MSDRLPVEQIEEALDYFEQEWQLNGRPYLWDARRAIESRPVMAAAAREHLSCLQPDYAAAWAVMRAAGCHPTEGLVPAIIDAALHPGGTDG